jgi:hypothetical protein
MTVTMMASSTITIVAEYLKIVGIRESITNYFAVHSTSSAKMARKFFPTGTTISIYMIKCQKLWTRLTTTHALPTIVIEDTLTQFFVLNFTSHLRTRLSLMGSSVIRTGLTVLQPRQTGTFSTTGAQSLRTSFFMKTFNSISSFGQTFMALFTTNCREILFANIADQHSNYVVTQNVYLIK